ncbi:hypothetical protein O6H91_03G111700 [Diphasiastrum complanatum]|uniref:Uncharacterized protein n=2 Tax=Diphasiastrum complanatum TaxID=34168 RepID=A0ACC2EAJ0_DIPCM|nr:hypothetical protein O6H91_03G111700 [Diphasiastrum complanatum]KAJ7563473.1 hypothetical protein O6H91_03G111700 [Diphasiastrum complanatum]
MVQMETSIDNRYKPPESFKPLDKAAPLVDAPFLEDKELWLIQIPSNELTPEDLINKKWNMRSMAKDGILGHFCSSRGDDIIVMKQDSSKDNSRYAFLPTADGSFNVRRITCQASFTRWTEIETSKGAVVSEEVMEQDMITPQSKDLMRKNSSSKRSSFSTISDRSQENQEESGRNHSSKRSHKKFKDNHYTVSDRSIKDVEITSYEGEHSSKGGRDSYQISASTPPVLKPLREELPQATSNPMDEKRPPDVNLNQDGAQGVHKGEGMTPEHRERSHTKKRRHQEHFEFSDGTPAMQKPSRKELKQERSNSLDAIPLPAAIPAANQDAIQGTQHKREEMSPENRKHSHKKRRKDVS